MKINKKNLFIASLCAFMLVFGFSNVKAQVVKDIDGNIYGAVKIGARTWTTRNLSVTHFRNGDVIPEVTTDSLWEKAGQEGKPACCYYENDTANCKKFGILYNWYAVMDPRGLAPEGWRIPSTDDWREVTTHNGGVDIAGAAVKSANAWKIKELATNKSGFSAVPAGTRDTTGKFHDINNKTHWWTTSVDSYSPLVFSLTVSDASPELLYIKMDKKSGLSVRCVKQ